jgi:hypothetical protein
VSKTTITIASARTADPEPQCTGEIDDARKHSTVGLVADDVGVPAAFVPVVPPSPGRGQPSHDRPTGRFAGAVP